MALVKMDTEQLDAVKAFIHKSVPVEFEEDVRRIWGIGTNSIHRRHTL